MHGGGFFTNNTTHLLPHQLPPKSQPERKVIMVGIEKVGIPSNKDTISKEKNKFQTNDHKVSTEGVVVIIGENLL